VRRRSLGFRKMPFSEHHPARARGVELWRGKKTPQLRGGKKQGAHTPFSNNRAVPTYRAVFGYPHSCIKSFRSFSRWYVFFIRVYLSSSGSPGNAIHSGETRLRMGSNPHSSAHRGELQSHTVARRWIWVKTKQRSPLGGPIVSPRVNRGLGYLFFSAKPRFKLIKVIE